MTVEIIRSITEAEAQAAEIRRVAQERAIQIVAEAQTQAANRERSASEVCRAYRETQIKTAFADAEKEYTDTLNAKKEEAKAYCEKTLEETERLSVTKIVGRIVGGSR